MSHIFDSDRSLRILDIGCGAGFFSIILSEMGHTVHGIDITPNMIDEANQLAESLNSDATFSVMDAEHHNLPQSVHHAHEHVSNELKERCHTIYHMLEISSYTRPQWDKELLTKMGASSVSIDPTVGPRIYSEEDEFYIPVPMFLVKAIK